MVDIDDLFKDIQKNLNSGLNNINEIIEQNKFINPENLDLTKSSKKVETPEWIYQLQSIEKNTTNISNKTSLIEEYVHNLENTINALNDEIEYEKSRAVQAERRNQIFAVIMAIFSTVIGIALPMFINWLKS